MSAHRGNRDLHGMSRRVSRGRPRNGTPGGGGFTSPRGRDATRGHRNAMDRTLNGGLRHVLALARNTEWLSLGSSARKRQSERSLAWVWRSTRVGGDGSASMNDEASNEGTRARTLRKRSFCVAREIDTTFVSKRRALIRYVTLVHRNPTYHIGDYQYHWGGTSHTRYILKQVHTVPYKIHR